MLAFLKALFAFFSARQSAPAKPAQQHLGANFDERPPEEQAKDPRLDELVATVATVAWTQKAPADLRFFGSQNQTYSSSCVAHATRKALRVLFKVNHDLDLDFSAADIYRRRANFPNEGMAGPDAFAIAGTGVQLNALMPSDNKLEPYMNNPLLLPGTAGVATAFKMPQAVALPLGDIEAVASVIQHTGKGVVLFYYFTSAEWAKYVPTLDGIHYATEAGIGRHGVCAVDFTLDSQGRKCLVIDDSAHFAGLDRRLITEDFHKARNFYAAYPMRFAFDPASVTKPTYREGDTVSLQDCLKAEGVFPTNVQSTGVYGPVTTQAVKDFQKKYGLEQVGTVGQKTTAKLHELYP